MASYYVDSVGGSDSNNGTTSSTPWQTITKLNTQDFLPGDFIYFKRGCTFAGHVVVRQSGMEGSPITFGAYGSGALPVIDSEFYDGGNPTYGIGGYGRSWLVIENIKFIRAYYYAIALDTFSHIEIRNCEITNSLVGINFGDSSYCYAHHNNIHDLIVNAGFSYGAIAINFSGSHDIEAAYNTIKDNNYPSEFYGNDGAAFEFWNNNYNIDIHHNWSYRNNCFMEAGSDGVNGNVHDVHFYYNVILDYGGMCQIHNNLGAGEPQLTALANVTWRNNTYVQPSDETDVVAIWYSVIPASTHGYFQNNIIVMAGTNNVAAREGFTHNNNIFYGANIGITLGTGDVEANPDFVDLVLLDFHLNAGSPAISAGADYGYTLDFDSISVGSPPDIGAYEYVETTGGSTIRIWDGQSWIPVSSSGGAQPAASQPYDVVAFYPGKPANSALLLRMDFVRNVTFPTGAPSSRANAGVAATASTTLTLAKNGVSIGTIVFGAGATTGTWTMSGDQAFVAGDILTITNQASADATLADISITFTGTR